MLSTIVRAIQRLPKPLITLLPMIFTFLGPGLLIWVLAFHIPVPYPQETMAPYPHASAATMELSPRYESASPTAVATAPQTSRRNVVKAAPTAP